MAAPAVLRHAARLSTGIAGHPRFKLAPVGAKVYYGSTAIVTAIVVPTAADLAFGMEYKSDRAVAGEGDHLSFRRIASMFQLRWQQQKLYDYNQARADSIATNGQSALVTSQMDRGCDTLTFTDLAPDR